MEDAGRFHSLIVDVETEVCRRVSIAEAAAMLGADKGAVSAFRNGGLLGRPEEHLGVDLEHFQAFKERYVLSGEIVRRTGIGWFNLTRTLVAAGIEPEHEWPSQGGKLGRRIYDRTAVERLVLSKHNPL